MLLNRFPLEVSEMKRKAIVKVFLRVKSLDETLKHGVKAYVQYKVMTGVIGFIVFLIIFVTFFLPKLNSMDTGSSPFMNGHEIDIQELQFVPK